MGSQQLHFEYVPCDSIPLMAWCLVLKRHDDLIRVYHGSWVETYENCFFEGAWDGPYDAFEFTEAQTFAGSGGRIVGDVLRVAAPSHTQDAVYSLIRDDILYIANSFTFVLTKADAQPDPNHPNYYFDFLNYYRTGIRIKQKPIPVSDGLTVFMHDCCTISVSPDLTVKRLEKPSGLPPKRFCDYETFLAGTVKLVIENAIHPARNISYRSVATISKGYDSATVAALAHRAGCREALTFLKSSSKNGYKDDSGTEVAGYLGLAVSTYERMDYKKCGPLLEAEFYISTYIRPDVSLLVAQDQLEGSLMLSGRPGERYWTKEKRPPAPHLQTHGHNLLYSRGLGEFRLRTGFIYFPVPYCGAIHAEAIHRITMSDEMQSWSIGGTYDRPIPRRILEESGVPREAFGQRKRGGFYEAMRLSATSQDDFNRFYETIVPKAGRRVAFPFSRHVHNGLHSLLKRLIRYIPGSLLNWLRSRIVGDRLHAMWGAKELYIFHWGFDRIRGRYSLPEDSSSQHMNGENSPFLG